MYIDSIEARLDVLKEELIDARSKIERIEEQIDILSTVEERIYDVANGVVQELQDALSGLVEDATNDIIDELELEDTSPDDLLEIRSAIFDIVKQDVMI